MISGKETCTQVAYEVAYDDHLTSNHCKMNRGIKDNDAQALALKRARELQTNLSEKHPSFVKQMLPSHVTRWFLLGLPAEFCRLHLPDFRVQVMLENGSGKIYMVNFHPGKFPRFKGGWRRFSVENKMLEGDVVVFHLVRTCRFKVYIIRANDDPTVAEIVNLASCKVNANEEKKRKREVGDPVSSSQESVKRSTLLSKPSLEPKSHTKAFSLSGNVSDFGKFFKIIVNNDIVDHELSRSIRFKYYKLCCSQKSYLHLKLLKSVDQALAAGIISGMVKLADTIRTCELNVSKDDFVTLDNTLEGFEKLGMEVGFLRDRLKRLGSVALEFRATDEGKRYVEAESKLECMEEKMRSSEMQIVKLKRSTDKLEDEMKVVKANIKKCRDAFHEEASAPW